VAASSVPQTLQALTPSGYVAQVDARQGYACAGEGSLQQLLNGLLCLEADDVVRDIRIVPSLSSVVSALRALRANRAATSHRSCFGEDTSLRQRVVKHRAGKSPHSSA
jgi:hypothetical protein